MSHVTAHPLPTVQSHPQELGVWWNYRKFLLTGNATKT
jgi:hypothetical protein